MITAIFLSEVILILFICWVFCSVMNFSSPLGNYLFLKLFICTDVCVGGGAHGSKKRASDPLKLKLR